MKANEQRVKVETTNTTDTVYNPGRSFLRDGHLDGDNNFWYDGNWTAKDNPLYRWSPWSPDDDDNVPEDMVIPFGDYKLLAVLRDGTWFPCDVQASA